MVSLNVYLLWFQTGYAIWQFFRYTKFLRFPYIVLASTWNSGLKESWFHRRKVLWIMGEPEFNTLHKPCSPDQDKLDECGYKRDGDNVFFKAGKKNDNHVYDIGYRPAVNLSILLSNCGKFHIGYKLLPLYKGVFILKCLPLEKAIPRVAISAAEVVLKENVFCMLDETTEDYLNENFLRIMSILPLSLQAKRFDTLSIYLSVFLLILDVLSVPANKLWNRFSELFIMYTKLVLARFPVTIRVPMHYLLSTGSSEFMFTDIYRKKTYWTKPGDFVVKMGNCTNKWKLKNQLRGRTALQEGNRRGEFYLGGQLIRYSILEEFDEMLGARGFTMTYNMMEEEGSGEYVIEEHMYGVDNVEQILYKISVVSNLQLPPVERVRGNAVYFTSIDDFLRDFELSNYKMYTSPAGNIYCS